MARKATSKRGRSVGKVGSSSKSARRFGGKTDFGLPESAAKTNYARRKSREAKFQPAGSHDADPRQELGTVQSARVSGVGKRNAGPGGASTGDIDTDVVGLDGKGLAQGGPDQNVSGPEWTTGGSEEFASGPPAKGENKRRPGRVGGAERIRGGSTVDRSGGDARTNAPGQFNIEEEAQESVQQSQRRAQRRRRK